MASFTPRINYTPYDIKRLEGTLDFDVVENKVFFTTRYANNPSAFKKIQIVSPDLNGDGIMLESVKFNKASIKQDRDDEYENDRLYFSELEYTKYRDGYPLTISQEIPRTAYMQKVITYPSTNNQNILIFRNPDITIFSEFDIRAFAYISYEGVESWVIKDYPVEILNVSVIDGMCTVTLPPITNINNAILQCRVYLYNPTLYLRSGGLKFNENYQTGHSYKLTAMNYVDWLREVLTTYINLETENDENTDYVALVEQLRQNLSGVINTVHNHIGDIALIGVYTEFNDTYNYFGINITALDVTIPYQTTSVTKYTVDDYDYYSISPNVSTYSPWTNVNIKFYADSSYEGLPVYSYDNWVRSASKIGYGFTKTGTTYYIGDSCNLGVHLE